MNKLRKQSDTTYPIFFFMVDSTDHITGKTGLSPTVTISKNGGSYASPSGAITEVGNGLYKIAGNATDSNTVGELWVHATATGADPTDTAYTIVAYDPFDSVRLGLTALPNAAAEAAGGLYTRGTGAGQINQPANGQIDANTVKISGTAQTARDLGASVLLSSGTGTGQISLSSGAVLLQATQTGVTIPNVTTVTNLTNAPTNGDLTGTMKTSITTAATAATPTVLLTSGTGTGQVSLTSGVVKSNLTQIDGLPTNSNSATLNLKQLNVVNSSGDAIVATSSGSNGRGILATGNGTSEGLKVIGGGTAVKFQAGSNLGNHGLFCSGSTAGGAGIISVGSGSYAGISVYNTTAPTGGGPGISVQSYDTSGNVNAIEIYSVGGKSISLFEGASPIVGSLRGSLDGNVLGSLGSLDTQAKTDVRTAVSTVLNTAIPPSPTVDSINERIVAIDTAGSGGGGSSAADVWAYPTRTLTPVGLGGSVVIPVASITALITEAFKKAGISNPSTDLTTRAQTQWLEEIRADLWKRVKKSKFLQARSITLLVNGLGKYSNPSDFESDLSMEFATGTRYGTLQAGTVGSITLATSDNSQASDIIGKEVVILSGSASGQVSYITGYTPTTKVAIVSPSFTVDPSTASYLIVDTYSPVAEKPIWEQKDLGNPTEQGTPDRFFPIGSATDGEFILWPIPYRTDSQPCILFHRYYADISEVDTTGALFATLLEKWRNLWLLGLKWKALDDADDDKTASAEKAYLKELQEITRVNYGNDLLNVQTKLGDY